MAPTRAQQTADPADPAEVVQGRARLRILESSRESRGESPGKSRDESQDESRVVASRQVPQTGEQEAWLVELRAVVASLSRVVADQLLAGVEEAGSGALTETLGLLDRAAELLTAVKGPVLRAQAASQTWKRRGHRSPEQDRAAATRKGLGAASRELRLAQDMELLPMTEQALGAGQITTEHAEVLSGFLHGGDAQARRDVIATEEERLIHQAKREDAGTFRRRIKRLAARTDSRMLEDEHERNRQRRYVRLQSGSGGLRGEFLLDPVAGAKFRAALDAHLPRPSIGEERTREQRQADALVEMASLSAQQVSEKSGGRVRPRVLVTVSADTFAAAIGRLAESSNEPTVDARRLANRAVGENPLAGAVGGNLRASELGRFQLAGGVGGNLRASELGRDQLAGGVGGNPPERAAGGSTDAPMVPGPSLALGPPPALLQGRTLLPPSQLAAALCDCDIGRLVLDASGQVLDIGRASRTPSPGLRLAVIARDQGCRYPGCTMPAPYCHAHHITWWSRGGVTAIDNLVLLCTFHHETSIHAHGDTITPILGGFRFAHADGTPIGTTHHPTAPA